MYGKLEFSIFYTRMIACIGQNKIVAKILNTKIIELWKKLECGLQGTEVSMRT